MPSKHGDELADVGLQKCGVTERDLIEMFDNYTKETTKHTSSQSESRLHRSFSTCTYHNFYSITHLKQVLLEAPYIDDFNIIDDIVDIICTYHGILEWSESDKSSNIEIIGSKDQTISYAKVKLISKIQDNGYGTIFFNEWIDLACNKKIFKYILKVSEMVHRKGLIKSGFRELQIGLVSTNFDAQLECITESTILGDDKKGASISWYCIGARSSFYYLGAEVPKCSTYEIAWHEFKVSRGFKSCDKDCFFMLQIDLINKRFEIVCGAIKDSETAVAKCDIPDQLVNQINETQTFRIGLSFFISTPGSFAVGLVKI